MLGRPSDSKCPFSRPLWRSNAFISFNKYINIFEKERISRSTIYVIRQLLFNHIISFYFVPKKKSQNCRGSASKKWRSSWEWKTFLETLCSSILHQTLKMSWIACHHSINTLIQHLLHRVHIVDSPCINFLASPVKIHN